MNPFDKWYRKECHPLRDKKRFQARACVKMLTQYIKGRPVGEPALFRFFLSQQCMRVAAEIDRHLANDPKAPVQRRIQAMGNLMLIATRMRALRPWIDYGIVRELLAAELPEGERDETNRMAQLNMIELLLMVPGYWSGPKAEIINAVSRLAESSDYDGPAVTSRNLLSQVRALYEHNRQDLARKSREAYYEHGMDE